MKKGALKNFANFTPVSESLFLIKLQTSGMQLY